MFLLVPSLNTNWEAAMSRHLLSGAETIMPLVARITLWATTTTGRRMLPTKFIPSQIHIFSFAQISLTIDRNFYIIQTAFVCHLLGSSQQSSEKLHILVSKFKTRGKKIKHPPMRRERLEVVGLRRRISAWMERIRETVKGGKSLFTMHADMIKHTALFLWSEKTLYQVDRW